MYHIRSLVLPTIITLLLGCPAAFAGDLYDAVLARDEEAVRTLLAAEADVGETGDLGTPLHVAAFFGDVPIAELLLAGGADLEAKKEGTTTRPLHVAAGVRPG